MKKIWWSWDLRMRWAYGFSQTEESFIANYFHAIDAAKKYGVESIVIWGFLRDAHGGIEAARRIRDYAGDRGISILPGVGIDDYGGVYYAGDSPYSLDTYIRAHPGSQALDEDGTPSTHRWPPTDSGLRLKACPSHEGAINYYIESIEWLLDVFELDGFQIEQGDSGYCFCEKCRTKERIVAAEDKAAAAKYSTSVTDGAERIGKVTRSVLERHPDITILSETYLGLTEKSLAKMGPVLDHYPERIVLSWQLYDAPGYFKIEEGVASPSKHGNAALRTNSDALGGELDDRENIARALRLAKGAGLEMTYIYGEYPDQWPLTRGNYETWAEGAED
jgi:hypothetical protein